MVATPPTPPGPDGPAIVVDGLEKTYPNGTQAVRGVSFQVQRGEIYGILGPNGAGKSTAIGVLGTLVIPTRGKASVDGLDVVANSLAVRQRIGFAMQEAGVDDLATGREFLILQARLYGLTKAVAATRAARLLELFELTDAADKKVKSYSGGMKRRVDLAAAIIHLPRILFLDEPTEGLDPRSRQGLWQTLLRLREQLGATILLSTHYMEEADRLCDRIAIIEQGKIVAEDTPQRLKSSVGGQSVELDYGPDGAGAMERAAGVLTKEKLGSRLQKSGTLLTAYVSDGGEAAPKILRALDKAKLPPKSLRIQEPTLDDVYLKYTGRKLEQAEAKAVAP